MNRSIHRALALGAALLFAAAAPGLADYRMEKALDFSGSRIQVKVEGASISARGGGSGVRVVVTSNRDDVEERYDIRFENDGDTLRIIAERRGRSWGWNWNGNLHFEIEMPQAVDLEADTSGGSIEVARVTGEVRCDTSGGSISVEEIGGNANLDTSGGSIRAERVTGSVVADTSGGSIRMSAIRGDVSADTSGGSISIDDAGGRVVAETSGGSIDVGFAPGNGAGGELSTSGGGVSARVDPGVALSIDARSSGRISSDLPLTVRRLEDDGSKLEGELNGGGAKLILRSSGGSVRIRPL